MHIETYRASDVLSYACQGALSNRSYMTKKYVAFQIRTRDRAGNIVRGFILGLAEFGSFGTRLYDLAGYPYEFEVEALRSDWQIIGDDMWKVIEEKKLESSDDTTGQVSGDQTKGKTKK